MNYIYVKIEVAGVMRNFLIRPKIFYANHIDSLTRVQLVGHLKDNIAKSSHFSSGFHLYIYIAWPIPVGPINNIALSSRGVRHTRLVRIYSLYKCDAFGGTLMRVRWAYKHFSIQHITYMMQCNGKTVVCLNNGRMDDEMRKWTLCALDAHIIDAFRERVRLYICCPRALS